MKKTVFLHFLLLCLILPIACTAMSVPESEAVAIKSGVKFESAVQIPETKFGQLFSSTSGFFQFEAPVTGNLHFYLKALDSEKGSTKGSITLFLYTKNREKLDIQALDYKEEYASCIAVEEGRTYVATLQSNRHGEYMNCLFSICFDGYHKASSKSEVTRNASCSKPGELIYPCLLCGYPAVTEEIPKLDHTPGDWSTDTEATCTKPGLSAQHCKVCGEVVASKEIPTSGHGATETVVTAEATCLQAGTTVERCLACGETVSSKQIPATGEHTPGPLRSVRAATCTSDGKDESRCSVCNTLLREETTSALGHSYSEWEVIREATKNEEGRQARMCFHCGHVETEQIEKLPKLFGIF
ncbi:MAG: hypothetical protein J6K32_13400 [Clostridia bacterium]|nr:hypothetical protein [Clostridia bacterium]